MFAAIRNKIKQVKATREWLQSPIGSQVFHHNERYFYGDIPNLADLPEDQKQEYINRFYEILDPVLSAEDPVLELRQQIVEYACDWGLIQTVRLTEEDLHHSFASDIPYISGELHHHWEDLIDINEFLKECTKVRPLQSKSEFMQLVNLQSAVLLYLVNGMGVVRRVLGDETDTDDWFKPFLESMLIWGEATNREELGLPSLLPGEIDHLWHGLFVHCVEGDYANPYVLWKTAMDTRSEEDSIDEDIELWRELRAEILEDD